MKRQLQRPRHPAVSLDLFDRAVGHHQAGQIEQAALLYHQILSFNPSHIGCLQHLGVICHQNGDHEQATVLLRKVISKNPDYAEAHNNLGVVLQALQDKPCAEQHFRKALSLQPTYTDALKNLAGLLFQNNQFDEAAKTYRKIALSSPADSVILTNLAGALSASGNHAEAEAVLRTAIGQMPNNSSLHMQLGIVLLAVFRGAEAEACYRQAISLSPVNAAAHAGLAKVLHARTALSAAESSMRIALLLQPGDPDFYNQLGVILSEQGRFLESEAAYQAALLKRPNFSEAYNNLGLVFTGQRRLAEAEAAHIMAGRLATNNHETRFNLSLILLLRGKYAEGWQMYEERWNIKLLGKDRFANFPRWAGEALKGRTLLVHAEQGLGDTIQFCRFVSLFPAGTRVILEVQRTLVTLISTLAGNWQVVARGDNLPQFDLHCPMLSLPLAFGITVDSVTAHIPYLAAPSKQTAQWKVRLAGLSSGLRVGLVWAGSARKDHVNFAPMDKRRSIPLADLQILTGIDGVTFFSLQKGIPAQEAAHPPLGMILHDFSEEIDDFSDTAALVQNLDLVICVDTAVAHLVGALGKPVWMLNRFDTCWRWLLEREDSPWYPTLRQFRQERPYDWRKPFARLREALLEAAANHVIFDSNDEV